MCWLETAPNCLEARMMWKPVEMGKKVSIFARFLSTFSSKDLMLVIKKISFALPSIWISISWIHISSSEILRHTLWHILWNVVACREPQCPDIHTLQMKWEKEVFKCTHRRLFCSQKVRISRTRCPPGLWPGSLTRSNFSFIFGNFSAVVLKEMSKNGADVSQDKNHWEVEAYQSGTLQGNDEIQPPKILENN